MNEAALRERIEYLEADNAHMRLMLAAEPRVDFIEIARAYFGIMPKTARVLDILMHGRSDRREAILHAYAGGDPEIDDGIIDVQIAHLRRAFRGHDIEIQTVWNHGYRLSPEAKVRINQMLEAGK